MHQIGLKMYENKTFWRILVTKQLIVAIDLHSMKKKKLYDLSLKKLIFWNFFKTNFNSQHESKSVIRNMKTLSFVSHSVNVVLL